MTIVDDGHWSLMIGEDSDFMISVAVRSPLKIAWKYEYIALHYQAVLWFPKVQEILKKL